MKTIHTHQIQSAIETLCLKANTILDPAVETAFQSYSDNEVIRDLIQNADIARADSVPLCQDTGLVIVFLEIGQEVHIEGAPLTDAVNAAVANAYAEHYLRKSVLNDPLLRQNTQTNTPAIIHTEIVPGDQLKIKVCPKGGGSENKSALRMLTPADGRDGVAQFVLETVRKAGASACPPYVVGVGIGGTFDSVALLAKKALFRELGISHTMPHLAELETELLAKINQLPIGPAGFGGSPTALAVHVEIAPCHIASLPVAVNIDCHIHRHAEMVL